jgi:hypothetical protein
MGRFNFWLCRRLGRFVLSPFEGRLTTQSVCVILEWNVSMKAQYTLGRIPRGLKTPSSFVNHRSQVATAGVDICSPPRDAADVILI